MTSSARQCFAFLLILVLTCAGSVAAHAQIQTDAEQAILIDVETKTVLFEKKADELAPPASMSKLMTLAVLFDALEAGKITLDTEFPVSLHAWRTGGAPSRTPAMFAPLNDKVRVEDLLQGIIVQSGNDACIIVAEGLAGTENSFAGMMTEYARKIGLTKSTFANSTGLPDDGQKMTVRELGMLTLHIVEKFPKYAPYFQQKDFRYRTHVFYNLNPLLPAGIGVDVSRVGFAADFGSGAAASAIADGRRLVAVVNGVKGPGWREADAQDKTGKEERHRGNSLKTLKEDTIRLLNWGFRNFEKFTVFNADEVVGEAMTWGGTQGSVKLRGIKGGPVTILLPKNAKSRKLRGEIVYLGPVKTPIAIGDSIGELRVTADGGISTAAPLEAAEAVGKGGMVRQGYDSLVFLTFGWLIHHKSISFSH